DLKSSLMQEMEKMYIVEPQKRLIEVQELKVESANKVAWAAWQFKIFYEHDRGVLQEGRCTAILRRIQTQGLFRWRIAHDHCSNPPLSKKTDRAAVRAVGLAVTISG